MDLFYDLALSGLPILLFTDPSLVRKFRILPATVKVIPMPLETFELYNIGMAYQRELPSGRTPEKDTKEFFSLMNTKIEFIKRAMEFCDDETLIWIDYGILKIVKNKERVLEKLKEVNGRVFKKMTLPGCHSFGRHFSVDTVAWRFAGGFFVIPRSFVKRFFDHSRCVLTDFCTQPQYKLTWEVNVWNIIEACAERENMIWYHCTDHDDTMILNIPLSESP
jgi:hypothetical protein